MKLRPILVYTLVALLLGAACSRTPADPVYASTVQPFLKEHCLGCHDSRAMGGLNLEAAEPMQAKSQAGTWTKVLKKLSTGQMPPRGMPRPQQQEIAAVTAWIHTATGIR